MIKKLVQLVLCAGFFSGTLAAQSLSPEQYIAMYKDIAIREMKRMGVPAAISLAQGLLETESGNSDLVKKSNNHFGIKCKSSWTAGGVSHDDDAPGECFRTYKTADDSYRDHSNFLRGSERYAFLFELSPTDYKGWAYGLKKAGYATNPKYPAILIKHIEQYNLQQYSLAGAGEVPNFEPEKFKDDPVAMEKEPAPQSAGQLSNNPVTIAASDGNAEAVFTPESASEKVNYINGSKCIFARKGTSLLAIATRYNISLQKLLDINELEDDGILDDDQLVFLQRKAKTCDKDFIVVQRNETLYNVAQTNGIQLESLLEYNQLAEDGDVARGTKLYLRQPVLSAQLKASPNALPGKPILYEVQAKDGLYSVAKKYNVSVQQIKEWNNLRSDDLRVGQQLIVGK